MKPETGPAFGHSPFGNHPYWTRERVIAGLRYYAAVRRGRLPSSDKTYEPTRQGNPDFPPARVVQKHFGSMVRGWLAVPEISRARIPLLGSQSRWTAEEDAELFERAGAESLRALAKRLHRSPGACKRRIYDLGTTARSNQGYLSAGEVARAYGAPYSRVCRMLSSGSLRGRRSPYDNRWLVAPEDAERVLGQLQSPKHSYRPENGYQTDGGDYERRYGLGRKRQPDGSLRRVERVAVAARAS